MDAIITVSGNLGTDVDYRNTQGYSWANFRLACTPRIRRGDEWVDGHTTWVNVDCGGRIADNVRDSLVKGDPVVVTGRLRTKVWESEGTRHERVVIEANCLGHDLSRGVSQFNRTPLGPATQATGQDEAGGSTEGDDDLAESQPVGSAVLG